jgi:diphthamide synthase (EF-2-diphthine--ammonia ligase)
VTKVILSWSSGKDSAWTLHLLRQQRNIQVAALLTTFNSEANRVAMHAVRRVLVEAQAERTGIVLVVNKGFQGASLSSIGQKQHSFSWIEDAVVVVLTGRILFRRIPFKREQADSTKWYGTRVCLLMNTKPRRN